MDVFVVGDSISIQYGPYLEHYLKGFCEYSRKEGTEEALKNLDIPQGANGGDSSIHNKICTSFHRYAVDRAAYNQAADEIMKAAGVSIIDLYTFTANLAPADELYCDHVHFLDHVRKKQGAFIAGWLVAHSNLLSS